MDHLLYGCAYYDEYMPYERLDKDLAMMKKAGINVIRIAESTWSTEEPEDGVFDFSHVTKVLEACEREKINVIIGTPTYAIPAWMAKKYPDIMVTDKSGRRPYGARQIMDITHHAYRFYCERIIRKLMEVVKDYSCVIGFQLDNETKHFGTSSENVQQAFVSWIKKQYQGDIERFNHDFGLDYWSNRINSWEQFPSVRGTINGSLGCAFEQFQRSLVTEFLMWQRSIVQEYLREDQFVTHNFDFAWKGHSYGVQTDVDHPAASKALTIAGCDIYHPSQDDLTGKEISFCGDMTRSLKKDNYLVIETEAQGFPEWTPYPGQLKLQAFSHLASGADSVMYWHWHSIHNACETYWKGILSHDLQENAFYREVGQIGKSFEALSDKLIHLKKTNQVAIMVSNEALTALNWFQIPGGKTSYNDVVRWIYDALYEQNIECDIIWTDETNLDAYKVIFVPALYSAPKEVFERLSAFAANGGTLVATFKTGFTDEHVKVNCDRQPAGLSECMGAWYDRFTAPKNVGLSGETFGMSKDELQVQDFMELVEPTGAKVLAFYDHYMWKEYAAVTKNSWGKGTCYYIACKTSSAYIKKLTASIVKEAGLWGWKQEIAFPVIIKEGVNQEGKKIRYLFNYSGKEQSVKLPKEVSKVSRVLKEEGAVLKNDRLSLAPWCFVVEEI